MVWIAGIAPTPMYAAKRHNFDKIIIQVIIDYITLFLIIRTQLHVTSQYYIDFIIHLV